MNAQVSKGDREGGQQCLRYHVVLSNQKAGRVWCSVPKGAGGPIQRHCQSRPVTKGLAFGTYGKWSQEVDGSIAKR